MTAYGVASRSIAFYGTFEFTGRNVLHYVFYPVYYLLYTNLSGELNNLEGLDGRAALFFWQRHSVLEAMPASRSVATHILLAFHMLLINILLVNLLIAMFKWVRTELFGLLCFSFSKSFQDVQSVQSDIWNYQQYAVVREYYDRPPLFIPLSTIFDIIALVKIFYEWYLRVRYNYVNPLQRVFSKFRLKLMRRCLVCYF